MNVHSMFAKPEPPPWKSAWRRDLEAYLAEQARNPAPRRVRCVQPKPQPKPRAVRAPKPRRRGPAKMKTLCQCGREIKLKDALWCRTCFDRPKQIGISPKCISCGSLLNMTNTTGLCRKHAVHKGQAVLNPRPVCKHHADGMRCAQVLYRTNKTGLCRWHGPDPINFGAPRMVPA